jgi:hypothetical protein
VLKVVTVGGRKIYIVPTVKGLVKEADEVRAAFEKVRPTAVGLSLSDRELAEIKFSMEEVPEHDYVPEARIEQGGAEEEAAAEDEDAAADDDDAEEAGDEEKGPGSSEVETPMGPIRRDELKAAMDEPFAPDLMAADAATKGDRVFVSDTDMTFARKLAAFGDVELPPPSFREAFERATAKGVEVVTLDLDDDEYTTIFCDHVTYWQLVRHARVIKRMRRMRASGPEDLAKQWDGRIRRIPGFGVLEREREKRIAHALIGLMGRSERVLAVVDLPLVEGVVADLTALAKGEKLKE